MDLVKPDRMAGRRHSAVDVRDALARNNYLSALGQTKGRWSRELVANPDLRTAEEFRQCRTEQSGVVVRSGTFATSCWARRNYEQDVASNGRVGKVHGSMGDSDGECPECHRQRPRCAAGLRDSWPAGQEGRDSAHTPPPIR